MEESDIDLRSIFGLLRRQFRLIVLTLIAVVAIAGVWVFAQTPVYTASATLMFDPSKKNLLEADSIASSAVSDNARIDSEVEIMRSENILLDVIREKALVSDAEFGVSLSLRQRIMSLLRLGDAELPTGEEALNQTLSKLRNAVQVQRRGTTYLLNIQVSSETPAKAADLANAVARSYLNDHLRSKIDNALASRDILQSGLASSRQAIVTSENSFDAFISENIDRIVDETGRPDILSMQSRLADLASTRQEDTSLADAVSGQLRDGNFSSVVASLQNDALQDLERQRQALNDQIANAGGQSPAAVDLQASLGRIEEQLRTAAQNEVDRLRNQVAEGQAEESSLRDNLRSTVLSSNLSADVLTEMFELQQTAAVARRQYETLLSRVQTLETQASLQVPDAHIVSPALPPSHASFPNVTTTMAIAAMLALGLGIALAFLYENFIGGFTSAEQLASVLKLRVAATTPRVKLADDSKSVADLIVTAPLSVFAEATRRVRASLEQLTRRKAANGLQDAEATEESQPKACVIMVTSAVPNEGKTTFSLALARSYALAGHATLLIDCDLRKPSIHRQLGVDPEFGFVDFLESGKNGTLTTEDVITKDPLSAATVIVGSRRSALPTDQLIGSDVFSRLLGVARKTFSVIILDTPPIGAVVDGLYIVPFADVVTVVSRWAHTPQNEVKSTIESLREAKPDDVELIAILSQQELSKRNYASKYGDYYAEPAN